MLPTPTNVRVTKAATTTPAPRLVRASDLQYLGCLRVPITGGVRMDFSYGHLTGRAVNGQQRLLMSGNRTMGDPIYEFADPGTYHPVFTSAPRMPLVKTWGDIYGGKRVTWTATGVLRPGPPNFQRFGEGIYWHEPTQLLYWTYADPYNVSNNEDWCLGATRFNADGTVTAFGPWRIAPGTLRKGAWHCTRLTAHPTTGEMLCGATLASGNRHSSWGCDLWAGPFPDASTPAGFGQPDLPTVKLLTYYPMLGAVRTDGTFSGPLKAQRRPGNPAQTEGYFFEPILGTTGYTQIDGLKNGGIGSWTETDTWDGLTWIDLPDRYGVIFTGQLGAQHVWYSNAGQGNLNCTHGVAPPPGSPTGPTATARFPFLMIYDPADLNAVRSGSKVDYTVDPVELINAETRWGVKVGAVKDQISGRALSGQYFNPQTRKLYICAPEADNLVPNWQPLVHVFQVN